MEVIETERLIIRHFQEGDAEQMYKNYCSSDNVTEHLIWPTHANIDVTKEYLTSVLNNYKEGKAKFQFAIVLKENNEVIGSIDYMDKKDFIKEIGWVIGEDYWGKGIMPEAAKATMQMVFDSGIIRIEAKHCIENEKSGRVMQKIGMEYEGTLRACIKDGKGRIRDCHMYSILNPNYVREKI